MARKRLSDEQGNQYDVDVPDDDQDDDDDGETLWLDEEDVEWLRRKRREESEAERQRSSGQPARKPTGKVVRIRAKQPAPEAPRGRKRVLKLA